jgi:5'-methylthioadenosine phosphorylase
MRVPKNASPSLCVVMSYSLLSSLRARADFHPQECNEDFPLGWTETDGCRFLVAARSSSIRAPHTVNYCGFARELRRLGCTHVISSALCGALDVNAVVPSLVVPDQFIDMHRVATAETPAAGDKVRFQDFSFPYCQSLRLRALGYLGGQHRYPVSATGCYVGVDGPRYETAAEVRAYRALGGDVVGMTAVREAIAYRHAGLCVTTIALITNFGAGLGDGPMSSADIQRKSLMFGDLFLDCGRYLATQMPTFECDC